EREARARPDDGAAQLGLASALARLGRRREALEAFLRPAASEPGDPEIQRALADVPAWSGPRAEGGPGRVPVGAPPSAPAPAVPRRRGQAPHSLAIGRGTIVARVSDAPREWRLVAVALTTGRSLWSREEAALAAAPPLTSGDAVIDATLVAGPRGTVTLRVRS